MVICRLADRVSALPSRVYFLCNLVVEQKDINSILVSVRLPRAGSELYWLLRAHDPPHPQSARATVEPTEPCTKPGSVP